MRYWVKFGSIKTKEGALKKGLPKYRNVKQTMFFRADNLRGLHRDENIKTVSTGKYLSDLLLEDCLCQL